MCSNAKCIILLIAALKLIANLVKTIITSSFSFSPYYQGLNYTYENNTGYVIKTNAINTTFNASTDSCTNFTYDQFQYLTQSIGIANDNSMRSNLNAGLIKTFFFLGVIQLFSLDSMILSWKIVQSLSNDEQKSKNKIMTTIFFLMDNFYGVHFFAVSLIDFNKNCIDFNIQLIPITFFDISLYYLLSFYALSCYCSPCTLYLAKDQELSFIVMIFTFPLYLMALVLQIVSFLGSINSKINSALFFLNLIFNLFLVCIDN